MGKRFCVISCVMALLFAFPVLAQNTPASNSTTQQDKSATGAKPASSSAEAKADTKPETQTSSDSAKSESANPESKNGKASLNSTKIPSGSKIYVAPMGGFENYVIAGILKKKVPVTIVGDRDKAEYEIRGSAETEKAGWAKMLFLGSQQTNEQASINVQEIKTGAVVFAYSVNKINSVRGKQSAGEAIGKHLNDAIGKD